MDTYTAHNSVAESQCYTGLFPAENIWNNMKSQK